MAIKQFNSVEGYSVGSTPNGVIDSNGNISGNAITATANVTSPRFISNVATGTAPFVVTSTTQVANLNVATAGAATTAGTVTTAAQPNITSVGTLSSLAVTGNANVGNLNSSGRVRASGEIIGDGQVGEGGQIVLGWVNTTGLTGQANSTWNLDVDSSNNFRLFYQDATGGTGVALTANSTSNVISTIGNISAPFFIGNGSQLTGIAASFPIANGNSNIAAPAANGNINISVAGNANVLVVTGTGVNVAGTLNVTGNANVGNLGATSGVFTNVSGNGAGLSAIAGANVTGTVSSATSATTAGTVTTAAQPNITSVGTLTSLGVNGTITGTRLISNVATGTAPLTVTSTTRVANLNVAQANVADFVNVTAGTGNNFLIFANAATGNIAELTSTGLIANLSNNSITATTFVGSLSGAATSATTAGTVTTAAQPNITSVGTLTSLGVNGTVTAVAFTANTGIFTGNGSGLSAIAGANVTGTVSSATTAGTVTTAAQPNITSVGTLTSLSVTGNVAAGNLTTTGILSVTGTGVSSIAGNLDMTSNTIINLATPTNPTDAATKQYVDDVAQGLNIHDSVAAATPTTLATITGGTITYNNGSSGVGANLTTTGSFNLIDGVNVQTAGTRILVRSEANAVHNGIYTWSNATVITRATDYDSVPEVEAGDFVFVTGGTLYDNTGWVQTDTVTAIGAAGNNINFTQFSGAGTYTAGTGLTLTGSVFSVNASQTQITSVGTLTGLNSSGTITAPAFTANTGVFTGNGSGLSAIAGANVTGAVAFATTANAVAGANVSGTVSSATTAGTVTTAAQPNITSVGTLTSLGVNGTVTAVAFTANTGVFTGNGSGLSAIAGANVTGTVASATSAGSATTAGTVTTAAQPNITSVGTLTSLGVNGTVTAVNFTANTGVFAGSGANLTTLNASNISSGTLAQARLANSSLTVNGTSIALGGSGTITATATNPLTIGTGLGGTSYNGSTGVTITNTGVTSIVAGTNIAVSGATGAVTVSVTGTVPTATTATTAGTVTTAAQPNITSVGTLTSLAVSGTTGISSTDSSGAASTTKIIRAVNGTQDIAFIPRAGSGAYNNLTTADDAMIAFANTSAQGNASLTIAPWASANSGIRIQSVSNVATIFLNGNVVARSNIAYVSPNGANTITSRMANGGTLSWNGNAGQLFSIVDSMTGNIFTVNDVSGIPLISVDAGGNIQFAVSGGFVNYGVTTGITAAGSTQGTATALTRPINVVSTVSASTGVILPTVPPGARVIVMNTSGTALNVYPPSGAAINSAATNAAYSMPAGTRLEFISVSATQWYTMNATYG